MSLFEFQMVLLSIIVGLGMSEVLSGFGRLMRQGRLGELTLPHVSVLLMLLLALVQTFWESWGLSHIEAWTYPGLLLMLTPPSIVNIMAHIVLPHEESGTLEDHYYDRSRQFYGLGILALGTGVLFRPLAFGMDLFVVDNAQSLVALTAFAALAWSRNPVLHRVLAPLMLIGLVLDTGLIYYRID